MKRFIRSVILCLSLACWTTGSSAEEVTGSIDTNTQPEDLNGSNFTYPYDVQLYKFPSQDQDVEMAFMDIRPEANNKLSSADKVAVLFHGKYFCGATWNETIRQLTSVGYRVIAPDQVGWCKSTKPAGYQVSQLYTPLFDQGFLANGFL